MLCCAVLCCGLLCCSVPSNLTTVDEVVDEIYAEVKNVEPMVAGKDRLPSTAFFLLYKLFELRLTKRQMHGQDQDRTSKSKANASKSISQHSTRKPVACRRGETVSVWSAAAVSLSEPLISRAPTPPPPLCCSR